MKLTNEQAWAAAAGWGREPRMNELEALMWRSERHPSLSSTVCALMKLDRSPDWERLLAAHAWGVELIPRFRQRVVEPLLPVGPPAWVDDASFDLGYHLRRMRLSGAGTMAEVLGCTESLALAPFDRARPLWEAVLIEGLEDGGAVYFMKLHHSLTDGMGGMQLFSLVQSRSREPSANKPRPPADPQFGEAVTPAKLALDELSEGMRGLPAAAARALRAGAAAVRDPGTTASAALRYAASLRRVLSPPPAQGSPLLRGRSGRLWRFGTLECPLADLKAAGKSGGGSVNDAFVAALLGGLRRYHERHGVTVETLPMAMPVSLRKADDPMGGNKFAGAMFAAPVGIADPAERIAVIRGLVLSVRAEPALDSISLLAPLVNRLPSGVGALASRLGAAADLSASNVPGAAEQTYLAGAKVERMWGFGPLPGVAVMVGMLSHVGTCCLGFNIDGSAVEDHAVLMQCFAEGLDEVLQAGRAATR